MSNPQSNRVSRAITRFVENPLTILIKGIILLVIGITEASRTFLNDLEHGQLRVGHGMIIIGIFSILDALPHLIDGLDATRRYAEFRAEKAGSTSKPEVDLNQEGKNKLP